MSLDGRSHNSKAEALSEKYHKYVTNQSSERRCLSCIKSYQEGWL